jgi:Rrf2 family protein
MLDLAVNDNGQFITLKEISERQNVAIKYLEQIISPLNKAGYLKSLRGNGGGYKLAKKPEQYVVGDILRVTEGSLTPVSCLDDSPNECPMAASCMTLPFWMGLDKAIREYIDGVTLRDLIESYSPPDNYSI